MKDVEEEGGEKRELMLGIQETQVQTVCECVRVCEGKAIPTFFPH